MPAEEPVQESKRPTSHKWALFVFISGAGVNILLNAQGWFDTIGVVVTVCSIASIISFLFFARSRRTYTLGLITLVLVFIRALQSLWFDVSAYFHGRSESLFPIFGVLWGVFLVFLLLRAYAVGAASRRYYGLPPYPNARNAI